MGCTISFNHNKTYPENSTFIRDESDVYNIPPPPPDNVYLNNIVNENYNCSNDHNDVNYGDNDNDDD